MPKQRAKLPLRIFVVENDPDTLKYLRIYLEYCGYVVGSATSMKAALELAPAFNCDVLLSDIGLGDGDGWELLRQIRFPNPVYAIAMSGYGTDKDRIQSSDAGYRHHLLKPLSPSELDAALNEAADELKKKKR
jgi:DNA-binding response OmpR family regulator